MEHRVRKRQVALRKNATESGIAAELSSLLSTIAEDGKIADEEVLELRNWLAANRASDLPSIQFLRTLVDRILADGVVLPAERHAVHLAIEKVLPAELRRSARAARMAQEVIEKGAAKEQARAEREKIKEERDRNRPAAAFNFMVAGVTYEDRAATIDEHLRAGATVFLVRQVENKYDRNAVQIITREGYEIGYVPRDVAAEMAPFLDAGFRQIASCTKILNGSRSPIPVVDVKIYRPDATVPGALVMTVVKHPAAVPPIPRVSIPERTRRRPTVSVQLSPPSRQISAKAPAPSRSAWWVIIIVGAIVIWIVIAMSSK